MFADLPFMHFQLIALIHSQSQSQQQKLIISHVSTEWIYFTFYYLSFVRSFVRSVTFFYYLTINVFVYFGLYLVFKRWIQQHADYWYENIN